MQKLVAKLFPYWRIYLASLETVDAATKEFDGLVSAKLLDARKAAIRSASLSLGIILGLLLLKAFLIAIVIAIVLDLGTSLPHEVAWRILLGLWLTLFLPPVFIVLSRFSRAVDGRFVQHIKG